MGGETVRKLAGFRVTVGLSQSEAAKAIGITQSAISKWERGDGKPTLDKIQQLAALYKVTVQEIVEACMSKSHTNILTGGADLDNDDREQDVLQNLSGASKTDAGTGDSFTGDS